MTKREICERLLEIWEMEPYKNTAEAIKHLLLDLATPEDHFADADKMVREEEKSAKEPPVLIYEENGEKVPCPACGEPAYQAKNGEGVFFCKRCGRLFCTEKREEGVK